MDFRRSRASIASSLESVTVKASQSKFLRPKWNGSTVSLFSSKGIPRDRRMNIHDRIIYQVTLASVPANERKEVGRKLEKGWTWL